MSEVGVDRCREACDLIQSTLFDHDNNAKLTALDEGNARVQELEKYITSSDSIWYESMRRLLPLFLDYGWIEDAKKEDRLLEVLREKQTNKSEKKWDGDVAMRDFCFGSIERQVGSSSERGVVDIWAPLFFFFLSILSPH